MDFKFLEYKYLIMKSKEVVRVDSVTMIYLLIKDS